MSELRSSTAKKDAWLVQPFGTSDKFGNGAGNYIVVGRTNGTPSLKGRGVFAFDIDLTGGQAVDDAFLYVKLESVGWTDLGSNITFWCEQLTKDFGKEGTESRDNGYGFNGGGVVWGDETATTANHQLYDPASNPGAGDVLKVPSTDIIRAIFASKGKVKTTVFLRLIADDETLISRCAVISSRQGSYKPHLDIHLNTNIPPVLVNPAPTADAIASSPTGTDLTMTATYTDTEGDPATQAQFQVYPDSSSDTALGTPLKAPVAQTVSVLNNGLLSMKATGLPGGSPFVKWRMRAYDGKSWSDWLLLQRAKLAKKPGVSDLQVQRGTLTPLISASISPGNTVTAYRIVVEEPTSSGVIPRWDSDKQTIGGLSGTRPEVPYGGQPLRFVPPTQYRVRMMLWNQDDVASDWTPWLYWTPAPVLGPDNMSPIDLGSKIATPTSAVTVADSVAFTGCRVRVYATPDGGTPIWDSGDLSFASTSSHNVSIPSGTLQFGQVAGWDAYVIRSGVPGDYSPVYPLRVNALPAVPLLSVEVP